MFMEIDFGAMQVVRAVELQHAHDQWFAKYELHGEIQGRWRVLAGSSEMSVLEKLPDYRRLAVDELKRNGIQYLVVQSNDYHAEEFKTNANLWPMRLLDERKGTSLFILE